MSEPAPGGPSSPTRRSVRRSIKTIFKHKPRRSTAAASPSSPSPPDSSRAAASAARAVGEAATAVATGKSRGGSAGVVPTVSYGRGVSSEGGGRECAVPPFRPSGYGDSDRKLPAKQPVAAHYSPDDELDRKIAQKVASAGHKEAAPNASVGTRGWSVTPASALDGKIAAKTAAAAAGTATPVSALDSKIAAKNAAASHRTSTATAAASIAPSTPPRASASDLDRKIRAKVAASSSGAATPRTPVRKSLAPNESAPAVSHTTPTPSAPVASAASLSGSAPVAPPRPALAGLRLGAEESVVRAPGAVAVPAGVGDGGVRAKLAAVETVCAAPAPSPGAHSVIGGSVSKDGKTKADASKASSAEGASSKGGRGIVAPASSAASLVAVAVSAGASHNAAADRKASGAAASMTAAAHRAGGAAPTAIHGSVPAPATPPRPPAALVGLRLGAEESVLRTPGAVAVPAGDGSDGGVRAKLAAVETVAAAPAPSPGAHSVIGGSAAEDHKKMKAGASKASAERASSKDGHGIAAASPGAVAVSAGFSQNAAAHRKASGAAASMTASAQRAGGAAPTVIHSLDGRIRGKMERASMHEHRPVTPVRNSVDGGKAGETGGKKSPARTPGAARARNANERWQSKVASSSGAGEMAAAAAAAGAAFGSSTPVKASLRGGPPGAVPSERGQRTPTRGGKFGNSNKGGNKSGRSPRPSTPEDRWRQKVDTSNSNFDGAHVETSPAGRCSPKAEDDLLKEKCDEAGIVVIDRVTGGANKDMSLLFPILSAGSLEDDKDDIDVTDKGSSYIFAEVGSDDGASTVREGANSGASSGGAGRRIATEIRDAATVHSSSGAGAGATDNGGEDPFVDEDGYPIANMSDVPLEGMEADAYIAQLAPHEEREFAVPALAVKVVNEEEEAEEELKRRGALSRRDKIKVGMAGLIVVGLAIGLGVGLSARGGTGGPQRPVCEYPSPWTPVNGAVTRPDELTATHTHDGTVTQFYAAFGSDATLSDNGTRLAAVDRYGDAASVYDYDAASSEWVQVGESIRGDEGDLNFDKDEFYEALAAAVLSGDGRRVVVTSPYHSTDSISRTGRVRVYEYIEDTNSGGGWKQLGNDFLGGYEYAYLGRQLTVDLSEDGSTLAVGDYRRNEMAGCVTVYSLESNNTWTPLGRDICGLNPWDRMGGSVSLSAAGDVVAIGSQGSNNETGKALLFQYDANGEWSPLGNNTIEPSLGYCSFGWPVSLSSNASRVAVSGSAYLGDDINCLEYQGISAGEVRVYELQEGNWTQMSPGFNGADDTDGLGWSVSLSGDGSTVAMGASSSDRGGALDSGYARAYRYECGFWTQVGRDVEGAEAHDWTGHAVSLSADGGRFAVSSPIDFGLPETEKGGAVAVYEHEFEGAA